ncbi:MAG: FAD-dependent oxidoreductase, partial [Spirochaetales bacterium]
MNKTSEQYDLVVIGSGISGLSCAIAAAEKGLEVAVITKESDLAESNTLYAQGGIVARSAGDTPTSLYKDILRAGAYINHKPSVRYVSEVGPQLVEEYLVNKARVPFTREASGKLSYTQEAAHSVRRILFSGDSTGKSIEQSLLQYAHTFSNIQFLPYRMAVDIITNTHNSTDPGERYKPSKVLGVYVLSLETQEIFPIFTPHVVLATGGVGNIFIHTSNPLGATGDGIGMALRVGCEVINAEYVQFHPTILYHRDKKRFLLTEALRGEGARLINHKGIAFMEQYNPVLKDLAPRDEVSRAIFREMALEGRGYVLLDATCCRV